MIEKFFMVIGKIAKINDTKVTINYSDEISFGIDKSSSDIVVEFDETLQHILSEQNMLCLGQKIGVRGVNKDGKYKVEKTIVFGQGTA